MPLQILTVRQFFDIFIVFGIYSVMTLFLPSILLHQKVCHMRFSARFMIYQTASNFYIVHLVKVLQFFHSSGQLTLILFTILPFLIYVTYVLLQQRQRQTMGHFFDVLGNRVRDSLPEMVLVLLIIAVVMVVYDGNAASQYQMSDLTAYNRWIYNMGSGQAAADGAQPLWLYSVVYYLHTVFRLDEFMLFRAFWMIQTLLLYFMLLAFLRLCCKLKYTAYLGAGIYILVIFLEKGVPVSTASLQLEEFGMLFVLTSAAFLFLFFETKKQEIDRTCALGAYASEDIGSGEAEEARVFLLDEVLAETMAKEAAYQERMGEAAAEEAAPESVVLIMEENAADGTMSIKECPLDGTISIQDTSIEEIAEHASDNIPLLDTERQKEGAGSSGFRQQDSTWYLVFFVLSFSMALSMPVGYSMIAGLFCVSICAGYCFRLFRIQYFWRILLAGMSSIVITVISVWLPQHAQGIPNIRGTGVLSWNAVYSYLLHIGDNWLNLVILLSVGLLVLLAMGYFVLRQTDYAARMLSVVVYMGGMTLLVGAVGMGILASGNDWGNVWLCYAYSMMIVWGLCLDGILQLFIQLR